MAVEGLEPALVARPLDLVSGELVLEPGLRGEDGGDRGDPALELGIVVVPRPGEADRAEHPLARR